MSTKQLVDTVTDYGTREAWLQARMSGIGASESAALFDLSPWHSRLSLWLEKSGRARRDEPRGEQAERMEWGRTLEGPIAAAYEKRTGRKLWQFSDFSIAQHPRIDCMFATPDRFIIEAPDRQGDGELQIKNTGNAEDWLDGPPSYVQCQVQHEMAVTGRDYAAVAVLVNGNRLMHWDVERNEAFIAELEEQCRIFWESIKTGKAPAVDGHRATLAALKRLHPLDNGEEVALPAEAAAWWEQVQSIKGAKKAAEDDAEAAEAQLRAMIGPNSFGRLPDGRLLSLKHTSVKARVQEVEAYTYRTLREVKVKGAEQLAVARQKAAKKAKRAA